MSVQYIFFYGTLMCPDVYQAVTGRELIAEKASLKNYRIYSLKNRVYPGIVPFRGAEVCGLMTKVDAETIMRLDQFEGGEYERMSVGINDKSDNKLTGWAYVLREDSYHILASAGWSFQNFLENDLANYLH